MNLQAVQAMGASGFGIWTKNYKEFKNNWAIKTYLNAKMPKV